MAGTAFDTSSDLLGQATDIFSNMGNIGAGQTGQDMLNLFPDAVTQQGTTVAGYGPNDLNAAMYGNMNEYLNPYYDQVLQGALGTMRDTKDQTMNDVGASATAAGAFGGSRHGLVESQVLSNYNRDAGNLAGNLKAQGFDNALTTAQGVLGMDLDRGQFMSGTQAGLDQNTNSANAQLQLALAQAKAGALGQGTSLDQNQQQLTLQQMLTQANGMAGMGNNYYNIGQTIKNDQATDGKTQQDLLQSILSGSNADFSKYMQDPYTAITLMQSLLSGDPRSGNQTGTSTSKPGLFDYLSLIAQGMSGTNFGG
jgi:hypothetical protein